MAALARLPHQGAFAVAGSTRVKSLVAFVAFVKPRFEERGKGGRPLANSKEVAPR